MNVRVQLPHSVSLILVSSSELHNTPKEAVMYRHHLCVVMFMSLWRCVMKHLRIAPTLASCVTKEQMLICPLCHRCVVYILTRGDLVGHASEHRGPSHWYKAACSCCIDLQRCSTVSGFCAQANACGYSGNVLGAPLMSVVGLRLSLEAASSMCGIPCVCCSGGTHVRSTACLRTLVPAPEVPHRCNSANGCRHGRDYKFAAAQHSRHAEGMSRWKW